MNFPDRRSAMLLAGGWLLITGLNVALLPRRYAPTVQIEQVAPASLPLLVRAPGMLEAKDSSTVKAQFDGSLESKNFREGQHVTKGEILAVMGRERIRLDYQNKKDSVVNAEGDLQRAQRELQLQTELFEKEAVAHSAVEDAQRAVVKSEQSLRGAKDSMDVAQDQWDSAKVAAPVSGTVVKDWIGEDKDIAAGKEIVTVADVSEFAVHARVDELEIHQIHENQTAEVRLQTFPGITLPAMVTEIGSQVDAGGISEIPVVIRLTGTGGLDLRPKLTAEARILSGQTEPVLSVPLSALVNSDGETHVWVVTAGRRLQKRPVGIGRMNPERVEITHGLAAGDRVVVTADPGFAEGARVAIAPAQALR